MTATRQHRPTTPMCGRFRCRKTHGCSAPCPGSTTTTPSPSPLTSSTRQSSGSVRCCKTLRASVRRRLWLGWTALGLKLGPPWSSDRVLGWKVKHSDPAFVLLAADSWLGLRGQLLFRREPDGPPVRDVRPGDKPRRPRSVGRDHTPPPARRSLTPVTRREAGANVAEGGQNGADRRAATVANGAAG